MLKFSEFWMLMFWVLLGCDVGKWYGGRIHCQDLGAAAWIGCVIGLVIGVLLLPVTNPVAQQKFRRLMKKVQIVLWELAGIIAGSLLFLILGIFAGLAKSVFTGDLYINDNFAATMTDIKNGMAQGIIGYTVLLVCVGFGSLFKRRKTV
ncbi:MAG: hypothetical protein HYV54_01995 [Parcubacteria group bacterium]|nr:hypothetical protein [Parcubacteria group bacterium]